jgi:MarR family transcriptional regulator, organic hydroperoxide resistance regulator
MTTAAAAALVPGSQIQPDLEPVLDFLRLLWAVDHGLQSVSKRMEQEYGIAAPARLVLRIVGVHPGIAAGQVAELIHVHPSTLTGILQRLQSRGLLIRKADPRDARRALLHLTAKGRRISGPDTGLLEAGVRRILARNEGQVAATMEFLTALYRELDEVAAKKG